MVKQCKACPWKKATIPDKDIPNGYCQTRHKALKETIARPGAFILSHAIRVMACHESPIGRERMCVGWAYNQIGPGNNIMLRLYARRKTFPKPILDGKQHETFEQTLPKVKKS